MTQPDRQSPPPNNKVFYVACFVLGSVAFVLLVMVGISFSLSERIVYVQVPAPAITDPAAPSAKQQEQDPPPLPPARTVARPRTVEEMLNAADPSAPDDTDSDFPVAPLSPPADSEPEHTVRELDQDQIIPPMSAEVAQLVQAARNAQIEGDLRIAVIKLEQALRLDPQNPVVLYYYGLTYEWLRNADKARSFFLQVYNQREKAGMYFSRAARHLQSGFESPADLRGSMAFGTIMEQREQDDVNGERVKLTIPVFMKDKLSVRPEDVRIIVQFFDKVNNKKIERTHAPEPTAAFLTEPLDWKDGEEIMEITYFMPPLTAEENIAYGSLQYYGYTAKLYYKGEPMDCHASPPVLFLIEQMEQSSPPAFPDYYSNDVLPPVDATPVSETLPPL